MSDTPKNGPPILPFAKSQSSRVGVSAIRPISTNKGVYVYRPTFASAPPGVARGFRPPLQRHVYPTTSRISSQHSFQQVGSRGRQHPRFISALQLIKNKSGTRYRQTSTATRWIRPNSPSIAEPGTTATRTSNANPGSAAQNQINFLKLDVSLLANASASTTVASTTTSLTGPMKPIVFLNNNLYKGKGNKVSNQKYKFPSPSRIASSSGKSLAHFQNGSHLLKLSPRRNFSVRKYSLKRIRKSSVLTSGPLIKGQSGQSSSTYRVVNVSPKRKQSASHSFSFSQPSQSQSVLRATRVVQRSKKLLSQSKRKKNTFCIFFNKFGSCRRSNEGCPFIHDPRQVLICSKYLGTGSCSKSGCTLSHNEAIGKVPSCKFFNDGLCVKENCPFRHHIDSAGSPTKKRKSLVNSHNILTTTPVIKLSAKSQQSQVDELPCSSNSNEPSTISRYFETLPDSQPIVSIIPRRPRKDATMSSASDESEVENTDLNSAQNTFDEGSDSDSDSTNSDGESEESFVIPTAQSVGRNVEGNSLQESTMESEPTVMDVNPENSGVDRRQRLLRKVTKFKAKSTSQNDDSNTSAKVMMPTFFKFN